MATQIEIEHEKMVMQLAKSGDEIFNSLTASKCELWHHMTGVATEVGELFDAVKKFVIYNKNFDFENALEELGDIEFYLAGVYQVLMLTREAALKANMAKLAKRYPNFEYTDQRAQERADKQEPPTDFRIAEEPVGLHLENGVYTHPNCPFMYCSSEKPTETCSGDCMYRLQA